jgi:hypothetical protein
VLLPLGQRERERERRKIKVGNFVIFTGGWEWIAQACLSANRLHYPYTSPWRIAGNV